MRQLWVGTSWKMHKRLAEARRYVRGLHEWWSQEGPAGIQPFVLPSFTALAEAHRQLPPTSPILLGAQNAHWQDEGAWTGEVSVPQIADTGGRIVELGHSERREHFGETEEMIRAKVHAVVAHGLIPLLCIGEQAEIRDRHGDPSPYLLRQAASALDGLSDAEMSTVLLAYEPVWAIGAAGRRASGDELETPLRALGEAYGGRIAALLYGGSVDYGNANELLSIEQVDGLFVGRAAWELTGFLRLLRLCSAHPKGGQNTLAQEGRRFVPTQLRVDRPPGAER
ncbi:triose-phosphate isomerase [Pseudactinotalea sp. HY158]|uniref:triose-phosphate isomerase n=1 Tax=Pseudactinotalea sp. HY158 TaxID=2654547 RepID=UPI00129CC90D|nr:triose-phosphate isomerase [Pseudactinotalea sp. HY158]QGH70062.1 triose-phosphate isomerase [Pseudactinotalea sp. HY158]